MIKISHKCASDVERTLDNTGYTNIAYRAAYALFKVVLHVVSCWWHCNLYAAACEALMMCRRDNPNMKHLMQGAYTWYAPHQTAFCLASVTLICMRLVPASMNQVLACEWSVPSSTLVLATGKEQLRHQPFFL